MPYPYVPVDAFREEYPQDADALGFDSEAAFETYLTRILEAESERVESDGYTGREWRDANDVPGPVADAVVRLTRTRIDARLSETLSSEQTPGGRQESYRPPREVREGIRADLADAGYGGGTFWSVTR